MDIYIYIYVYMHNKVPIEAKYFNLQYYCTVKTWFGMDFVWGFVWRGQYLDRLADFLSRELGTLCKSKGKVFKYQIGLG